MFLNIFSKITNCKLLDMAKQTKNVYCHLKFDQMTEIQTVWVFEHETKLINIKLFKLTGNAVVSESSLK